MKIVIDTNIVFSALLSKNNKARTIIFKKDLEIYTCNFLFIEIFKKKDKLLEISKFNEDQLLQQMINIFSRINFISVKAIPKALYKKAYEICKPIDESNTPFIALSMFLNAPLLTGDKALIKGLKNKGFNNLITIGEISTT